MKNVLKSSLLLLALIAAGCGSGGGGESNGQAPEAAALAFPINNSECLTGTNVSATESKITFEWNAAANAETYILYVKDLLTQQALQYNAQGNLSMEVTLKKGNPYLWYVVSKAANTETVGTSEKWKFYNAGDGVVSYVPFPADAVAPGNSSSIAGPTVNLEWEGHDLDDDIVQYRVYMDTTNNPATLVGTTAQESLAGLNVASAATYYWKVVSIDAKGNNSESQVFQFKTY